MKKILLSALAVIALAGCDQSLTRNFGGTTNVSIPQDAQLLNVTWKEHNLWVLYFEPSTGRCVFKEQSVVGVLQGSVVIEKCNPLTVK